MQKIVLAKEVAEGSSPKSISGLPDNDGDISNVKITE